MVRDRRVPRTGFSFRRQYADALLRAPQRPQALELMVESFMARLPARRPYLEWLRREHALTAHSVGLSIGSVDRPPSTYLDGIARLLELVEPLCYSDHLAMTYVDGRELGHLTPLTYDEATLEVVARNLEQARRVLAVMPCLELIAEPFLLPGSPWDQGRFAAEVHRATGCGLHMDVANLHINATNFGFDPVAFIDALPLEAIEVVHVVGFGTLSDGELVDTHDRDAQAEVMALLRHLLTVSRPRAIIIERDGDLPSYDAMMAEVGRVTAVVQEVEAAQQAQQAQRAQQAQQAQQGPTPGEAGG